ncbi:MAG: hypothetical protein CM15mP74_24850 [Halieaceae bacterium]|nr:MAG: hypothetical protein CM15mP74_24850 [Halieaceae bacterium]
MRPFRYRGHLTLSVLIVPPLCLIAFMMSITITDHSVISGGWTASVCWAGDRLVRIAGSGALSGPAVSAAG